MAPTSKTTTTRSAKTTITKKPPGAARSRPPRSGSVAIDPAIRHQMIAEAAYLRAEMRGFSAGDPIDDWLAAEQEVDSLLAERATQITQ